MIEFFKVRATSIGSKARTLVARLFGVGAEFAPDDGNEPVEEAEVLQPAGLVARPATSKTLEAVVVRDGDEVVVLFLIDKGASKDATAGIAEGETRLVGVGAGNASAMVRITVDGDIEVRPKAGRKAYIGGIDGSEPIVLGDTLNTFLSNVKTWLDGHTHIAGTLAAPNGPVTGATGAPAAGSPSVPDIKADNANAK